jgi:hypothetical protein
LKYLRLNQKKLRANLYQRLQDAIVAWRAPKFLVDPLEGQSMR